MWGVHQLVKPKYELIENLSHQDTSKKRKQILPNFIHEPGDSIDKQRSVEGGNILLAEGELGQQNENGWEKKRHFSYKNILSQNQRVRSPQYNI